MRAASSRRGASSLFLVYNRFPSRILFADGDVAVAVLSLREDGPAAIWSNEGGRFRLQGRNVGDAEGTARFALIDTDGDGDLDLLGAGLDRETGKSDLRLFINTLPQTRQGVAAPGRH